VIVRGAARLVELGDAGSVVEAHRRLRADLDALAGRRVPPRLVEVVAASLDRQLRVVSAQVVTPLRPLLGERGLVIVPAGSLSTMAWGLVPELRGRPVAVVPSASFWYRARRRDPGPSAAPGGCDTLLVAGPGLRHAAAEIGQIAARYPAGTVLTGRGATVAAVLERLDGARMAHLAAHGHHEPENVLFSRLDLADGPLMAYDVEHLAVPPRQVVLSACDVGRAEVRSGEEILGFTAALLYAGTSTVVASVARLPDEVASRVTVAYHRALAGGVGPAEALAAASRTEPMASFVCFGAG
jgi:hypothetical protein